MALSLGLAAAAGASDTSVFRPPPLTLSNETYQVEQTDRIELKAGVRADPNPVFDRAMKLAEKLVREEQYSDALRLLDAVLQQRPDDHRALVMRSAALTELGRFVEALEALEQLLGMTPDSVALKNNAAWIYATAADPSLRDGARAVELAQEALLLAPRNYHVWSTMSEGYYVSGQFAKALRFAEEALRMATQHGAAGANLREYRNQVRKNQAALHAFRLVR